MAIKSLRSSLSQASLCSAYQQLFIGAAELKVENFYRTQVSLVRSMGLFVSNKLTIPCANLTDVTLADEDTNSILTENAKRAIQGNVAMQVTQPGGKICN